MDPITAPAPFSIVNVRLGLHEIHQHGEESKHLSGFVAFSLLRSPAHAARSWRIDVSAFVEDANGTHGVHIIN